MPYKLETRSLSGKDSLERNFEQPFVRIGREEMNDVQLQDPRNLVSRRHAEIRERGNQCWIIDLGSKNGTQLNEERLVSDKEYKLIKGDHITIGNFLIKFIPTEFYAQDVQNKKTVRAATDALQEDKSIDGLFSDLNRIYWDNLEGDQERRKLLIKEVLSEAVRGFDVSQAEKLIARVRSHYPGSNDEDEMLLPTSNEEKKEFSKEESEAYKIAYDGILKIAGNYLEHLDGLESSDGVAELLKRIEQIIDVVFTSLASAMKGRKQFEQELDVQATRAFSWKLNPVKELASGAEIGAYLLGRRDEEPIEKVMSNLKGGFDDLALHNMGLIAGFKECLRGLLRQLEPGAIETEGRSGAANAGLFKILCQFEPLRSWSAWNYFKKKHQELTEEEVKTFENILGPYFEQGYLSVQKRKKVS